MTSACADLAIRLTYGDADIDRRFLWTLGAHLLFTSALVLGIIAVRQPNGSQTLAILNDLIAYSEMRSSDPWLNDFEVAEIKVIEMCIAQSKALRQRQRTESFSSPRLTSRDWTLSQDHAGSEDQWASLWSDPNFVLSENFDIVAWEKVIENLAIGLR